MDQDEGLGRRLGREIEDESAHGGKTLELPNSSLPLCNEYLAPNRRKGCVRSFIFRAFNYYIHNLYSFTKICKATNFAEIISAVRRGRKKKKKEEERTSM